MTAGQVFSQSLPAPFVVLLTSRELDVVKLVASGYSAKEVALYLGITPRTVESKIERVRLKVGARNRTHMVARAAQLGLV